MSKPTLEVVGIGNAVVDVLTQTEDSFLVRHDLAKGAMTLVDEAISEKLYIGMGSAVEVSGGSAANTMAGIASLGGKGGFIGKVKDDQLGEVFRQDISSIGVRYTTPRATDGASTARCLIFVTPDAQRTMQTFLGASVALGPADLDEEAIKDAQITYLEGYLWASDSGRMAVRKAAEIAHAAGRKVAFTLSDAFLVDTYRADFFDFIRAEVDILFANEVEITSLIEANDFDDALQVSRDLCDVLALTRSEHGSVVISGNDTYVISAVPVLDVVDTTGAGDLYAAGFLFGLTRGLGLHACGRIGSICAGEIVSHFGARPETTLADMIASELD